jgi:hypothetical protein
MTQENKKQLDTYIANHYQWLEANIKNNIAKGRMGEYAEDLLHQQIMEIYNSKDEEKIERMVIEDKLRWYILTCAGFSLRSSTSPFYKIHRQQKMWSRENYIEGGGDFDSHSGLGILDSLVDPDKDYDHETLHECFERTFNDLHWYSKVLMTKYWYDGWSLPQMYKHYNISKGHLVKDMNKAINEIREKCSHCNN